MISGFAELEDLGEAVIAQGLPVLRRFSGHFLDYQHDNLKTTLETLFPEKPI
jgi:hypothetical protein